jgi:hypothetical protein
MCRRQEHTLAESSEHAAKLWLSHQLQVQPTSDASPGTEHILGEAYIAGEAVEFACLRCV